MPNLSNAENVYKAVARNLRDFGYAEVTPLMVRETWYAMQNKEPLPHGVIGMFARDQLNEAFGESL